MHIKKSTPHEGFTKISNSMWVDGKLTDGAKILYGFLVSLPNGKTIYDGYLAKSLNISPRTVTNRKSELSRAGLILMVPLAPRVFDLYIGYPGMPATKIQSLWTNEDNS